MDRETANLVQLAKDNPWHLFNSGEIAAILSVDSALLTAINKESDTPLIGKKGRPEWVIAWLQEHRGFVAK